LLARSGTDQSALARSLLDCLLRQVMVGGTFHADPHPGNVLVLRDQQLALIDFGSVGRLDPIQQAGLRRLVLAVARRNPSEWHDALLDLAQVRAGTGNDLLERTLAQFIAQHLGPGMTSSHFWPPASGSSTKTAAWPVRGSATC
jgi:ubiquinone biosynthesis protein